MRSYIRKIRNGFLLRLVLFSLFYSSAVWADIVTFQYKGVITKVDSELRRVGDSAFSGIEVGYEVGDTFSGEYTFSTDSPPEDLRNGGIAAIYKNVITGMSFASGRNSFSATKGSFSFGTGIRFCRGRDGCNEYYVLFTETIIPTSSTNFFNGVFIRTLSVSTGSYLVTFQILIIVL
jgi:hypothetical protein